MAFSIRSQGENDALYDGRKQIINWKRTPEGAREARLTLHKQFQPKGYPQRRVEALRTMNEYLKERGWQAT